MQIRNIRILILIVIAIAFVPTFAQCKVLHLGRQTVYLPSPKGWFEISAISEKRYQFYKDTVPPGNEALALYLPKRMMDSLTGNDDLTVIDSFAAAQVLRETINNEYSESDHKAVINTFKVNQQKIMDKVKEKAPALFDKASEKYNELYDSLVDFSDIGMIPLGSFYDDSNFYSYLFIAKFNAAIDGSPKTSHSQLGSCTIARIKDKIIYLYIHNNDVSKTAIEEIKQNTIAWIENIRVWNSPEHEQANSLGSRDTMILHNELDVSLIAPLSNIPAPVLDKEQVWLRLRLPDLYEGLAISNMREMATILNSSTQALNKAINQSFSTVINSLEQLASKPKEQDNKLLPFETWLLKVELNIPKQTYLIRTIVVKDYSDKLIGEFDLSPAISGTIFPGSFWESVVKCVHNQNLH